jgi:hypothetical protein
MNEVMKLKIRRQAMERNSDWNGNRQTYRPVIRGDLFYADLSPVRGSEQGGIRPVLVIQNGTTKLVNIKNQDGLTKVLDMVPDFVDRFAAGKNSSETTGTEI